MPKGSLGHITSIKLSWAHITADSNLKVQHRRTLKLPVQICKISESATIATALTTTSALNPLIPSLTNESSTLRNRYGRHASEKREIKELS